MAVMREFNTTLYDSKKQPVQVTLVLFHDYIFVKFNQLNGWGTLLQCDVGGSGSKHCPVKVVIGDRACLEYQLWGSELASPIHQLCKLHHSIPRLLHYLYILLPINSCCSSY
eukprot:Gregarina_sp_Poly_1__9452@NODE_592_length_7334_cov_17_757259_g457_i0_p8_GENE_NODE_592_length_7334_cov_17_757259_g457_i0NODE_592_length_7334_cov_17_757259_g457_i0_p8_ORF_typecomplete_len112_score1_07_NODE_592_length_7334_cov_17_757259_g457_i047085043